MTLPAKHQRLWRIGSIVFFLGLPFVLVFLVVSNLSATRDLHERSAQQKAQLAQIVARLARHKTKDMSEDEKASLYLTAASGSLARAEVQQRVTTLVDQAGGHIVESQPTGTPEDEAVGTVAIQTSIDIDNRGLLDLLYSIESGLPLMSLSTLDVRKSGDAVEGKDDGQLHVQMTVQGHFRKGTG